MPAWDAGEVRLRYGDEGEGGPALLLVHGWASRLEHWQPQAEAFSPRHRVVRTDLRGHGQSSAPEGGYTIEQFAEDTATLAGHLGLRDAVVVGHSMGGAIVLQLAAAHPQLVRALVLVDSGTTPGFRPDRVERHPMMKALRSREYPVNVDAFYRRFFPGAEESPLARRVSADAARTPEHVLAPGLTATLTADAPAMAARIPPTMPVLYVNASRNARTSADVRAILPRAEFAQVVGGGHFLQLETPEQLNAMLRRFIDLLDGADAAAIRR